MKTPWLIAIAAGAVLLVAAGVGLFMYMSETPSAPAQPATASNMTPQTTTTPATTPPAGTAQNTQPPAAQPANTTPTETPPSTPSQPSQPTQPSQPATQQVAQCPDSPPVPAEEFVSGRTDASFCASGHLVPGSGNGDAETNDWAPGMRFPIDQAPAYANSQVWGVGGTSGPPGGQGDARNYSYPWHDDFCEARGYATMMCPSGKGHQGQDIRPAKCCDSHGKLLQDTFVVDAVEDGRITSIGTYTVYLTGDSGRLYRYLHMDMKHLKVNDGDRVTRGQPLGYLSNYFGSAVTTFHLHFEIKAPVSHNGTTVYTWVSPYPSLVASYTNLLNGHP